LAFSADFNAYRLQMAPVQGLAVLVLEGFFGPQGDLAERERNGPAPSGAGGIRTPIAAKSRTYRSCARPSDIRSPLTQVERTIGAGRSGYRGGLTNRRFASSP
jgi:hypothetical protein